MKVALFGLVALVLLWSSGHGLAYKIYGAMDLGWAFNIKVLRAIVHLAVVVFINYYMLIIAENGQVPDTTTVKFVRILSRNSIMLVLFGGANTATA